MVFKFNMEHFKAPTPKKMKQVGNVLVTLSTSAGTLTLSASVWAGIAIALLGIIGKVILSFYAEDDAIQP